MKDLTHSMNYWLFQTTLLVLFQTTLLKTAFCLSDIDAPVSQAQEAQIPTKVLEAELDPDQAQLLDLAFQAASEFPLEPHLKNRSRAQERVVEACFALDAPDHALRYIEGIANWRRGTGYANYAHYLASHAGESEVQPFLDLALSLGARESGWRKQRIYSTVARTYLLLGDTQAAGALLPSLAPLDSARMKLEGSSPSSNEECTAHMAWAEETFLTGDLDLAQTAFNGCVRLYQKYYGEAERREELADFVQTTLHKAPMDIAIGTLLGMARAAAENGDQAQGMRFVLQVEAIADVASWLPEHKIPMQSKIAEVRFVCGDPEGAKSTLREMQEFFAANVASIVDIFRSDALLPLAEAFLAVGNSSEALATYTMAVEQSSLNPNSRPRVDDLVEICCSMAKLGVNPGEQLMEQLQELRAHLGTPW